MGRSMKAPQAVRIWHKQVGASHIFTSPDLPGLHIGDPELRRAFDMISPAVSLLVEAIYGVEEEYVPDTSFENLEETLHTSESSEGTSNLMIANAVLARALLNNANHNASH